MADIHDYLAASRETDGALEMLRAYCGQLESGIWDDEAARDVALVLGLGFAAVAAAIREASTRADYVARDNGAQRG